MIVLDPKNLKRISSEKLFEADNEGISLLSYEPTQMVFVGSNKGNMKAINIIPQQMSYVYLDLGNNDYCTVTLNRNKNERNEGPTQNNKIVEN